MPKKGYYYETAKERNKGGCMWGNRKTVIEVSEDLLERVFSEELAKKFLDLRGEINHLEVCVDAVFARQDAMAELFTETVVPKKVTTEPHKPDFWVNGVEITESDLAVLVKCGVPFKIEYSDTMAKKKGKGATK
jgi:hypothetical protein